MIIKECMYCGKEFITNKKNRKYCCLECSHKSITKDLTGKKFGRLTAIKRVENKGKYVMWLCRCECGNETIVRAGDLSNNNTKSCGCLHKEGNSITHNLSKTRLYKVWLNIRRRCFSEYNKKYKLYGGRGITMCDDWKNDFETFYNWAYANGYNETLARGMCTIDRIDVNGNYEPNNCRWVTQKEQMRNTRRNRLITYNGETHCLVEWAEILGIKESTLKARFNLYHWSIEKAFTEPILGSKKGMIDNEKQYSA